MSQNKNHIFLLKKKNNYYTQAQENQKKKKREEASYCLEEEGKKKKKRKKEKEKRTPRPRKSKEKKLNRKRKKKKREEATLPRKKTKKKERQRYLLPREKKKNNNKGMCTWTFLSIKKKFISTQFFLHFWKKTFWQAQEKTPRLHHLFSFSSPNQTHSKKVFISIFSPKFSIHPISPPNKHTLGLREESLYQLQHNNARKENFK